MTHMKQGVSQMITDEMVEKAARLLSGMDDDWTWAFYQDKASEVLAAVLPDIVEQCAREIEKAVVRAKSGDSAYDLANAVRALAGLSFQDGKK